MAFIGDSFTSAIGASTPANGWDALVSSRMGWDDHNFACGGTGYLATYQDQWRVCANYQDIVDTAAATHPDIVVISGGLNDLRFLGTDSAAVRDAVNTTYTRFRDRLPSARIIAIGPVNADWAPDAGRLDAVVQPAAQSIGAQYISLLTPPPVLDATMYSAQYPGHPNDAGYAAIAARILATLQSGH